MPAAWHGVGFCHRFVNTRLPADATAEKRCATATKEAIAKISQLERMAMAFLLKNANLEGQQEALRWTRGEGRHLCRQQGYARHCAGA